VLNRTKLIIVAAGVVASGCQWPGRSQTPENSVRMDPIAVQQVRAYPETVTGLFVSLVDFEEVAGGPRGFEQVKGFAIRPAGAGAEFKFVVNITRTGAGAMAVTLPKGSELVFNIPGFGDFSGYTLLSVAVYSERLRDDLVVSLSTDAASWRSHRKLIKPGWNTVLIDIQQLESRSDFDIAGVQAIALAFTDAAGPVRFNLDDIMLINNARELGPTPRGLTVRKSGLGYAVSLPGREDPLRLTQQTDGLWRFDACQPTVQILGPDDTPPPGGELLERMGARRVGHVEVLEVNGIRVRLANTWYFPARAGEWVSMGVRRIRWEYTFYGDGRWVTHVELNNSGGQEIAAVRIRLGERAAWSDGSLADELVVRPFAGPVGRWSYLLAPNGLRQQALQKNHLETATVTANVAAGDVFAAGDFDRDRFDESQGCYFLASSKGHCRFTIDPPPDGLLDAAFRIAGKWPGRVSVNCNGLAIRKVVRLADGSALFVVPGWVRQATAVEVAGRISPVQDR